MGAFMIIVLKRSAEDAWITFKPYHNEFLAFRDATSGTSLYDCNIYDCLKGLEIAIKLGWYNFKTFDPKTYEHFEKVENGDLNWIIPKKFIAFMGPHDSRYHDGYRVFTPEDYGPLFKKWGVNHVVRLNKEIYDKERFVT